MVVPAAQRLSPSSAALRLCECAAGPRPSPKSSAAGDGPRRDRSPDHDHRDPRRYLHPHHRRDRRRHRGRRRRLAHALAPQRRRDRPARQRRLRQALSRRQHAGPLDRRPGTRLRKRHLGDLSPMAGARRPGAQRGTRDRDHLLEAHRRRRGRAGCRGWRWSASLRRSRLFGIQPLPGRRLRTARYRRLARSRAHPACRGLYRRPGHPHDLRRRRRILPGRCRPDLHAAVRSVRRLHCLHQHPYSRSRP